MTHPSSLSRDDRTWRRDHDVCGRCGALYYQHLVASTVAWSSRPRDPLVMRVCPSSTFHSQSARPAFDPEQLALPFERPLDAEALALPFEPRPVVVTDPSATREVETFPAELRRIYTPPSIV